MEFNIGIAYDWIKSYLCNRQQFVRFNILSYPFMIFSKKKINYDFVNKIDFRVIDRVNIVSWSFFYENLSWEEHVKYITIAIVKEYCNYVQIKCFVNKYSLRLPYCTLLLYVNYCVEIW